MSGTQSEFIGNTVLTILYTRLLHLNIHALDVVIPLHAALAISTLKAK